MPMTRKFIITATIVALLASGFPVFNPGDADHDQTVDLRDAVLQAMAFARTADTAHSPGEFQDGMTGVLAALKSAAGLNTVLKTENPDICKSGSTGLDAPFFISADHFDPSLADASVLTDPSSRFRSVSIPPPLPPPRFGLNG